MIKLNWFAFCASSCPFGTPSSDSVTKLPKKGMTEDEPALKRDAAPLTPSGRWRCWTFLLLHTPAEPRRQAFLRCLLLSLGREKAA